MLLSEIQQMDVENSGEQAAGLIWKHAKDAGIDIAERGRPVYRGMKQTQDVFIGNVKTNRKPKDMPQFHHEVIDDFFENNFGIAARSETLFAVPAQSVAGTYTSDNPSGRMAPHAVFPIGQYSIIFSHSVEDLYNNVVENMGDLISKYSDQPSEWWDQVEHGSDEELEEIEDVIYQFLEDADYQHVDSFAQAPKNPAGNELMIDCDRYLAIRSGPAIQGVKIIKTALFDNNTDYLDRLASQVVID